MLTDPSAPNAFVEGVGGALLCEKARNCPRKRGNRSSLKTFPSYIIGPGALIRQSILGLELELRPPSLNLQGCVFTQPFLMKKPQQSGALVIWELEAKSELLTLKSQNGNAAELLEFGLDKLVDLKQTLNDIKEPEIRFRFQKWLFPVGLTYDGEKFGTAQMPLIFRLKKNTLAGILTQKSNLVAPVGLEPTTQGSSGLCSTNWATEPLNPLYHKKEKFNRYVIIWLWEN